MNGNKTTATSSEERRIQRGISVLAFFVPAFIMLVLFIIRGIYPFGDRSFCSSDMYHRYMPFLSEFVHKIKAGEGTVLFLQCRDRIEFPGTVCLLSG